MASRLTRVAIHLPARKARPATVTNRNGMPCGRHPHFRIPYTGNVARHPRKAFRSLRSFSTEASHPGSAAMPISPSPSWGGPGVGGQPLNTSKPPQPCTAASPHPASAPALSTLPTRGRVSFSPSPRRGRRWRRRSRCRMRGSGEAALAMHTGASKHAHPLTLPRLIRAAGLSVWTCNRSTGAIASRSAPREGRGFGWHRCTASPHSSPLRGRSASDVSGRSGGGLSERKTNRPERKTNQQARAKNQ